MDDHLYVEIGAGGGSDRSHAASLRRPAAVLDEAPYRVATVTLVVRDLDTVADFYRRVIGLTVLSGDADTLRLGTAERTLVVLRHEPGARARSPREAGLFHVAFLLPDRGRLGAWLRYAAELGVRLSGSADHRVSEAVYLGDPEGNGVEIYADRPASAWPWTGGTLAMRNAPLDVAGLMHADPAPWTGMPSDGRVGHVHLQVGDVEAAERFYAGLLGFDVTCRFPGATFLGAGGYHHQLAANVWNSRGAPVAADGVAGLGEIVFLTGAATCSAVRARLGDAAPPVGGSDGALVVRDPWGIRLKLVPDVIGAPSTVASIQR